MAPPPPEAPKKPPSKYDDPAPNFPYKIKKRLNILAVPRKNLYDMSGVAAFYSELGVRKSALKGQASDRVNDLGRPYMRKILMLKKTYKSSFDEERLQRIDKVMQQANKSCYSKLANCVIDLKNPNAKDKKKKKAWSESDWVKHMEYIGQIANPKRQFEPPPIERGEPVDLEELMPRIQDHLVYMPEFKLYRRLSQESNYRDPTKVAPSALKYVISERIKKLATPRVIPED